MDRRGYELPLLLFGAFTEIVDETHRRLAASGHPKVRPAHGFAMQAIGQGATVGEVGQRLGVSKQAAAKTIGRLTELGYVVGSTDPDDGRRRIITATDHGRDLLARSARIFDEIYAEWGGRIGRERLRQLGDDLATVGGRAIRLDAGDWLAEP